MTRAVLALGSNLDDREANLRGAVAGLGDVVVAVSGVYETPPWGDPDQPHYLNAVLLAVDPGATPATGSTGPTAWRTPQVACGTRSAASARVRLT